MTRRRVENQTHQDQYTRALNELSALVMSLLRSPITLAEQSDAASFRRPARISPSGLAWLMLGISVSLMLCGSVTFFIGFMMMPWLIGFVLLLYVAGVVSAFSVLARSVFCFAMAPSVPRKQIYEWKFL